MTEWGNDKEVLDLSTKHSHHQNITIKYLYRANMLRVLLDMLITFNLTLFEEFAIASISQQVLSGNRIPDTKIKNFYHITILQYL